MSNFASASSREARPMALRFGSFAESSTIRFAAASTSSFGTTAAPAVASVLENVRNAAALCETDDRELAQRAVDRHIGKRIKPRAQEERVGLPVGGLEVRDLIKNGDRSGNAGPPDVSPQLARIALVDVFRQVLADPHETEPARGLAPFHGSSAQARNRSTPLRGEIVPQPSTTKSLSWPGGPHARLDVCSGSTRGFRSRPGQLRRPLRQDMNTIVRDMRALGADGLEHALGRKNDLRRP